MTPKIRSSTNILKIVKKSPQIRRKVNSLTEAFGKVIHGTSLNNQIKIKFREFLEKLNDKDTKLIGFNELKSLINKYNESKYSALYLPILLSFNKNYTSSAKEFQVVLIGYTVATCGWQGLSGEKNVFKIVESLEPFMKV
jgi:hypothetical protein